MFNKIVLMERPEKEQAVYKALVENPANSRIVFMGTPDFAVGCLKALVEAGMNVVAVVTMPDKQKGRGQKMQPSPVKEYALQQAIPVMQPTNLKDEHFLQALEACRADLQIVVAFRMLPRQVWAMPPLGTFNLHASVLPRYRGAAPIQRAIWNGEKTTGVTTFLLDDNMDTGSILYQQEVEIADSDNADTLHDKLLAVGAPLVVKTAKDLLEGKAVPQPQNQLTAGYLMPTHSLTKPTDTTPQQQNHIPPDLQQPQTATPQHLPTAPKIFKNDCLLNPEKTAQELHLQVRALSPYPAAFINLKHKETGEITSLKIFESEVLTDNTYDIDKYKTNNHTSETPKQVSAQQPQNSSKTPKTNTENPIMQESYQQGTLVIAGTSKFFLVCANNTKLSLKCVQLSGKQRVSTESFLRGFRHEAFSDITVSL